MLQILQRRCLPEFAIFDTDAGFAVFVDNPVCTPGQVVVQLVGGILGLGTDTHANRLKFVEAPGNVLGNNGNKPWRQAALRDKGLLSLGCQGLDKVGAGHVFR